MKTISVRITLALSLISLSSFAGDGVKKFPSIDPASDSSDLRVLNSLSKDTDLLAIGESVHGSAGFIQMEHRITRYLVEKRGFRTILLENPVIRTAGLSEWVKSCASSEKKKSAFAVDMPIDLLYQPIEEDRTFLQWMCDFNRVHPNDPVAFRGMDIWDRPWEHQAQLERVDAELGLGLKSDLAVTAEHCWLHSVKNWDTYPELMKKLAVEKKIPDADYIPCSETLAKLRKFTEREIRRSSSLAGKSIRKRRYALHAFLQSLNTAAAYQGRLNFVYLGFGPAWNQRDQAQAANEYSIWEQEGKKPAVLIAHTSHTSRMRSTSDWWKTGVGAFRSGLSFLEEKTPLRIRNIGLTGYRVTGVQGDFLTPTSADSLDVALHGQGVTSAWVNPRGSFVRAKDRWWIENENDKDSPDGVYMVPKDNFDLFVFLDESLRGKDVLPWHSVWRW